MYEADKKELAKLQAHFEILEKQYDAIMEERRLAEEEKARKEEEEEKTEQSCCSHTSSLERLPVQNDYAR